MQSRNIGYILRNSSRNTICYFGCRIDPQGRTIFLWTLLSPLLCWSFWKIQYLTEVEGGPGQVHHLRLRDKHEQRSILNMMSSYALPRSCKQALDALLLKNHERNSKTFIYYRRLKINKNKIKINVFGRYYYLQTK